MICWNSAQIIYREAEWQRLLLDNPFYICVSVQQKKLTVSHMQKQTTHSELLNNWDVNLLVLRYFELFILKIGMYVSHVVLPKDYK